MTFRQKLKKLQKIQNVSIETVRDEESKKDVFVVRMQNIYLFEDEDSEDHVAAVAEGETMEEAIDSLWDLVIASKDIIAHAGFMRQRYCYWNGTRFVKKGEFEFRKEVERPKKKDKTKKDRFNMLEFLDG